MKFQKGILSDPEPKKPAISVPPPQPLPKPERLVLQDVEKNRLFETQEEFHGSTRNYLKAFGIVVIVVLAASALIFYFTLPGIGDQVRTPAGLEDAVRENFSTKQKRTATDIVTYQCEGYYWLEVGVETRTDIANPIYKVGTYSAKAEQNAGGEWQITAQPVTSPEKPVPCK